jgi:two-component system NarL family sensor kinase
MAMIAAPAVKAYGRLRARAGPALAVTLFAVAATDVGLAVIGSLATGQGYDEALNSFVVTNATMGLAFSVCGLLIAWQRLANPIGWLLILDGIGHATAAAVVPVIQHGQEAGWPIVPVRVLATVGAYAWPWSIGLFLPLILQLFPDGRPAGPAFRWLMWATVACAPLFVLEMAAGPEALVTGLTGYLTIPGHGALGPLWTVTEVLNVAFTAIGLIALVVRYRRGDERQRRQLLWLLQAVLIVLLVLAAWGVFQTGPVYMLLAIPLIPVAMMVAILRHQLLDIRLVISRTVLYALLTAAVVGAYLAFIAVADTVIRRGAGLDSSVAATVLIAVGFNPVRVRLQRGVDRVLYGDRSDPMRAVSRVGERLDAGLPGVLEAVREALRIPFAALRTGPADRAASDGDAVGNGAGDQAAAEDKPAEAATSGVRPQMLHTFPLRYGRQQVGELVVGLRPGEKRLDAADRAILELLTAPLSVAVHAVALSAELQRSREAIVVAREEERRRLRRDLHDGLGPTLTGVTFKADAAGNLIASDPTAALELVTELRTETAQAISEIRRLIYDLRPPALDDLGLVEAIRQRAVHLERDGITVHLTASGPLPPLSAAVETAAFRIATEALNNAVRHSDASRIDVRIEADEEFHVQISDNGTAQAAPWRPGVGLSSMRERAAELGGSCTAGPSSDGGQVLATLPLRSS